MTTRFNILLSPDGIALARSGSEEEALYRFQLDPDQLPDQMAALRNAADAAAPEGWETVLVLPDDQILYTRLTLADGPDPQSDIRERLDGLTPYEVDDLQFDWEREDEFTVQVAAVAQETLTEAEDFAAAFGLKPAGFTSNPPESRFPREAWFGVTQYALENPTPEPVTKAVPSSEPDLIPVDPILEEPTEEVEETLVEDPSAERYSEQNEDLALDQGIEDPEEEADKDAQDPVQEAAPTDNDDVPSPALVETAIEPAILPSVPTPEDDTAENATSPETVKQDLRQILIACTALLVLSVAFWAYLSYSDGKNAPVEITETSPLKIEPAPIVTADPVPPEDPDLPLPSAQTAVEELSPQPQSDGTAVTVAPESTVETPPLRATPALPLPTEQRTLPLALNTNPPVPSAPIEEEVVEAPATEDPEPVAAESIETIDAEAIQAPVTNEDPETSIPETVGDTALAEITAETAAAEDTEEIAEQVELTPEELAELEEEPVPAPAGSDAAEPETPEPSEDSAETASEPEEGFDIVVIEGAPEAAPAIRPVPEIVTHDLAQFRPAARPDTILPRPELRVVIATEDAPGYRPAPRPAALSVPRPTVIIASNPPIRPTPRPRSQSASINDAVREATSPQSTSPAPSSNPGIPTSASIAERATDENALRLRQINLIGVFGSQTERRALVRLPSGRILRLQVGDRLDGGKVSAITDSALTYVKRGQNVVLKVPNG